MILLLVNNIDQFDYYKGSIYFDNKSIVPMTYDIGIIWALEHEKIYHINLWDLISPTDLHCNSISAFDLSRNWWVYFNLNLDFDVIKYLEASQQEFIYPFEAALNASFIFNALIEKVKFDSIIFFDLERIPILRTGPTPVMNLLASVSQSIFLYLCHKRNITYIIVDNWSIKSKISSNSSFFNFAKNVNNFSFTRNRTLSKNSFKGIYLIDGSSKIEYNEIKRHNYKIEGECDLLILDENILDEWFICDSDYLTIACKLDGLKTSISLTNNATYFPEIFSNEFFQYQFNGVIDEIKRSIRIAKSIVCILNVYDLSFVLLGTDTFTNARMISSYCKEISIPCLTLLHSGLCLNSSSKWILGKSEHVLTWNIYDELRLSLFGVAENRFSRIGSIRYENFELDTIENNLIFNPRNVLILTSAINTDLSAINADAKKHLSAWKAFLRFVNQKKNLQFVIRSHPNYDNFSIYEYVKRLHIDNLSFDTKSQLQDTLSTVDICIMFNCLTTAALDAMILQKPVVFFNDAIFDFFEFGDVYPQNFCLRIYDFKSLEIELEKILEDTDYRAQLISNQNQFLKRFFEGNKNNAINKLWEKLDNIYKNFDRQMINPTSNKADLVVDKFIWYNSIFPITSSTSYRKTYIKTILIFNKKDSFYNLLKLLFHFFVFRSVSKEEIVLFIKYILQTRLCLKINY